MSTLIKECYEFELGITERRIARCQQRINFYKRELSPNCPTAEYAVLAEGLEMIGLEDEEDELKSLEDRRKELKAKLGGEIIKCQTQ